jgi:hypothetical protein
MKEVFEGQHRCVIDQVGVVDRHDHEPEFSYGQYEAAKGSTESVKIALPVALKAVEHFLDLFDNLLVGAAQGRNVLDEVKESAKGCRALRVAPARSQDDAARTLGRQAGCVQ